MRHLCNTIRGVEPSDVTTKVMLLESTEQVGKEIGVEMSNTLIESSADGLAHALITKCHSFTHRVPVGTDIGHAEPVELVESEKPDHLVEEGPRVNAMALSSGTACRKSWAAII